MTFISGLLSSVLKQVQFGFSEFRIRSVSASGCHCRLGSKASTGKNSLTPV